jgi:hypothetical protein
MEFVIIKKNKKIEGKFLNNKKQKKLTHFEKIFINKI